MEHFPLKLMILIMELLASIPNDIQLYPVINIYNLNQIVEIIYY